MSQLFLREKTGDCDILITRYETDIRCLQQFFYYLAVKETLTDDELKELTGYNHFTDIEFSPEKSLNTQARSVVMIKLIYEKYGKLPEFSPEEFIDIHRRSICK